MGEFYFSAAPSAAPALLPPGSKKFDGAWEVKVECLDHTEGSLAKGYTLRFTADVKNGVLDGQYKAKGAPGSLTVNGRIQPDGTSELKANGITDEPAYSVNNIARGTPYGYRIKARFDDARGTGSRVEGRTCNYSFVKK